MVQPEEHCPKANCVPSPKKRNLGGRGTEPVMGGSVQPPIPLIANVVNKILSYNCWRIIVIAPRWPNMSWFWDLVSLSSQMSMCLPSQANLLAEPFNGSLHRNLHNLKLHA